MADWKLLTCSVHGEAFVVSRRLDWPVPLTGTVTLRLSTAEGNEVSAEMELQTDFSGGFTAYSSDGRFELSFSYLEELDGRRYMTGAVTRHRGGEEDVECFTAVTRSQGP